VSEVINLRQEKKRLARLKKRVQGAENSAFHGRTKAQKALEAATTNKAVTTLDQHRREPQ